MQTLLKTFGSSVLISLLLILPFMLMEVVNRRNFNEDFPFLLFFIMWFNLFAINLILLLIVRGRRTANPDLANPVPRQGNTLLTNPKSTATISLVLILVPLIVSLLNSLGWSPTGPNSVFSIPVPTQLIALILVSFPVVAGIIAAAPIASSLRAGGSLFTHPINLLIVVFLLSIFAIGFATFVVDQWPCFIGVPNCD